MILLLDNYDSFTYNLRDYFLQLGVDIHVYPNDMKLSEIKKSKYSAVVLSPGPGKPSESGNLMEVLEYYHDKVPVLGICLGHQAIGTYFGASLTKASKPMHGKVSEIVYNQDSMLFSGFKNKLQVVRYHSLVLENLPECLKSTSETKEKEIMSIEHKYLPVSGIQFHPEAYLTQDGIKILQNWITFNKLVN